MKRLANAGLVLLTVGLAAIAFAMVAVPAVTGTQAVTIDRNSMQEVLPIGSLAYIEAQDAYAVGDYVTYHQNGNVITHEIVAVLPNPATAIADGTWFQTKGTHNALPDDLELDAANIIGKVVWHAPAIGLAPKVLGTLPVRLFLLLTAVALLYVARPERQRADGGTGAMETVS